VSAYDVRPAAREQIESVGARAIELDLDTGQAEGGGGYAAAQSDDQNRRQLELLAPHVADADVVITTAAVPGARSPELVTSAMVEAMERGSVLVDLAAARGGNCRLTVPDGEVTHHGVTILGPTDLASRAPSTSSQMFANNVLALIKHLAPEGDPTLDLDDEITAGTVVTRGGEIVHPMIRDRLGLSPIASAEAAPTEDSDPESGDVPADEPANPTDPADPVTGGQP
ncbi:MAG: NAD(P)(+) transhydrogenase (Re/Si-specific) subunit alpha, partial [Actinomycetota bacterium]